MFANIVLSAIPGLVLNVIATELVSNGGVNRTKFVAAPDAGVIATLEVQNLETRNRTQLEASAQAHYDSLRKGRADLAGKTNDELAAMGFTAPNVINPRYNGTSLMGEATWLDGLVEECYFDKSEERVIDGVKTPVVTFIRRASQAEHQLMSDNISASRQMQNAATRVMARNQVR